ncbi:MAG: SDR family NAD(P)-dependent oxidoreductase [Brachybacterium sp.]|uniref:SDR family NAD(P)-dependent oxidoreductase n=1 Tax=Brachybacterium sp. TaxID=1891286 RepID=UPI00264859AF|nr:SDR family NAD(P)-dependent oxidoreductase [Brachybacterium sp.]MDN5685759.1 SDR family NAD(P)-dependent oxidoreductase [Brachybacterium sp.]
MAAPTDVVSVAAGATVLITGAAHGMGALFARRAAQEGARAIGLWDLDAEAATRLAEELTRSGAEAHAIGVDLARLEEIEAAAARTRALIGDPDIVINNAGIVRGVPFWEHDPVQDIELTMRINALAPMWLTREVLPAMRRDRSRPRRLLNIASAAGILSNPGMSVYAASKWAMIGWSDSLRLELERSGDRHLAVTTFCPSFVSTGMFEGARGPRLTPIMTPERAVEIAWDGMEAGRALVTAPWTVKAAMAARGIMPTRAWDLLADRVLRVYSSMDRFTGHRGI